MLRCVASLDQRAEAAGKIVSEEPAIVGVDDRLLAHRSHHLPAGWIGDDRDLVSVGAAEKMHDQVEVVVVVH